MDGAGDVYAANGGYLGGVELYGAAQFGALKVEGSAIDNVGYTLAVNPATNQVTVNEGTRLVEYDKIGDPATFAGEGELERSFGVAISAAGTYAYAGNASGRVEVFGASVVLPDAIGAAPTSVSAASATINGS